MRVLIVHPGPDFSVADVARGWGRGLQALKADVYLYPFGDRLQFFSACHIKKQGEWVKALSDEHIVALSIEAVGNAALQFEPEVVMFIMGTWIPLDLVDCLRSRGIKTVLLATESPYEDDRHAATAAHFDVVVLNDPTNCDQIARVNPRTFYAPHSYDPTVHYPGPATPSLCSDVVFVGTGYPSRVEFLEQVDWTGIDLALLGQWNTLEDHDLKHYARGEALDLPTANDFTVDWYRSAKSSLNLYRKESNRPELATGWAMGPREVELAATGCFYLTEERGENRQILPFVPTFDSPGDYTEKVRWWLAHDDARADVIGRAREAVAGWTFQERARKLWALLYP